MKKHPFRNPLIYIACIFFISSCSHSTDVKSVEDPKEAVAYRGKLGSVASSGEPISLDLFAARGSLFGSSFERYVLKNNILWRECGEVSKTNSTTAKLTIKQRHVEDVSNEQLTRLNKLYSTLKQVSARSPQKSPLPGGFFALTSPGILELQADDLHVLSSVDATSDEVTPQLKVVRRIFEVLRGVGSTICDSPTFYGIGKQQTANAHAKSRPLA